MIINSRSQESVEKTLNALKAKYIKDEDSNEGDDENEQKSNEQSPGQRIYGFAADLSKSEDCTKLVEYVDSIGHLDVLINNVGTFTVKDFKEITDDEWLQMFNVNVMSTVRMCRAFLPKMLEIDESSKRAKGGNIIIISSECGARSLPVMLHYSLTKAAQLNISRGLAEMTKGVENVRVNSILPGPTWTKGVEQFMRGFAKNNGYGEDVDAASKAYFKEFEPDSLKQGWLDPLEIANATLYLSSDAASGSNGSAFKVEGGLVKIAF